MDIPADCEGETCISDLAESRIGIVNASPQSIMLPDAEYTEYSLTSDETPLVDMYTDIHRDEVISINDPFRHRQTEQYHHQIKQGEKLP